MHFTTARGSGGVLAAVTAVRTVLLDALRFRGCVRAVRRARLVLLLPLLGPLLGFSAYWAAQGYERDRALDRFRELGETRARWIAHEVGVTGAGVTALASFLQAVPTVSAADFHTFATTLLERAANTGVLALEWAPRVERSEREQHEKALREQGFSGYRIRELSPAGEMVPAAQRDVYFPVRFIEPADVNRAAIGFDLASESSRHAALAAAARTGQPALSDPVRLVQETARSFGVLLFVPVLGAAGEVRGFAIGVIRMDNLLAVTSPDPTRAGMSLQLLHREPSGRERVFFERGVPGGDNASIRQTIRVAGQEWSLKAWPTDAFLTVRRTRQPLVIGLGTFVGFELLLGLGVALAAFRRERALRSRTDLLRRVIGSIPVGVAVSDASGQMIVANRAAQAVLGDASRDERAGWSRALGLYIPGTDLYYPDDELPLSRALRGEDVVGAEVLVRNPSLPEGALMSVSGAPLRDDSGALAGGVVVFMDITERRRTEALFGQLSSAVEQATDTVFITDCNGVIEYVNPAFERTTGYSRDEALGQTPRLLKSGKQGEDYYRTLWRTLGEGHPFTATVINRKRSGEQFFAEQTITPMRDRGTGEVTHFVSVMRDITERRQLAAQQVEMDFAAAVQQRLFPREAPLVPGYDIAGVVRPAIATCGDYFDFIPLADGRLAFVVADVCGHGLAAALIMAETRALLRSRLASAASITDVIAQLDRELFADLSERLFVTMILVFLEPVSGRLEWINMGHPPAFVLNRAGVVRSVLRSSSTPLGLLAQTDRPAAGIALVPGVFTLDPGDSLLMLTDGVIESTSADDEELGIDATLDVVRGCNGAAACEVAAAIISAASRFRGDEPQQDDVTVVVCRRIGPSAPGMKAGAPN